MDKLLSCYSTLNWHEIFLSIKQGTENKAKLLIEVLNQYTKKRISNERTDYKKYKRQEGVNALYFDEHHICCYADNYNSESYEFFGRNEIIRFDANWL